MESNPSGKKRPVIRGPGGRMTPIPWLGGSGPLLDEWNYVSSRRARAAELDRLCIMCGEYRGNGWVYALVNGTPSDEVSKSLLVGIPSPTYGHPECILKAVLYCPHLKNQEYPAMNQDRTTKLSVDNLKRIVQEKKKNKESIEIGIGHYDQPKKTAYDIDD